VHELSIALSILELAETACREGGHGRIEKIRIRVGRASGVLTDALQFCFEAAREGTAASGALLEIEEVPVGGTCSACGEFSTEEKFVFACPCCGSADFTVSRGSELDIIDMEVED
jgi:hydrogenase nickel incorporation protein HypA/HybF